MKETTFRDGLLIGQVRAGFAELRGELRTNTALLMEARAGRRVTNSLVIGSALAIIAVVFTLSLVMGIGRANAQGVAGHPALDQVHAICMKHNGLAMSPLFMPEPGWEICSQVLAQWDKSHAGMTAHALSPQDQRDKEIVQKYIESMRKP